MNAPLNTVGDFTGASTLMVLLPGAYMTAQDYAASGFFAAAAARRLDLDIVAVDLDIAAISAGTALAALHDGILAPARERYRRLWLGGISLGGLLALGQAADHPGSIDGLCLIAPYPGSRLTTLAIAQAGGLADWQITNEQLTDPEFRIWSWLRSPTAGLPVFVGWGSEDRFAQGMAAIADCFPESARCLLPGDHDWPVWSRLWERFLDRSHFRASGAG
jgi:pimeloyl-ACP methyl ester carboxylesterase